MTLALGTVVLNGVACYAGAQALGGSQAAALAWTGLFLAVLAGGEAALGFCRDRSERAWRALVIVTGLLVILLGGLRLWFLAAAGTGLVPAIAGACLFMVATAGFLALGYRALLDAETPPPGGRAARRARRARPRGSPGPRRAGTRPKGTVSSTPTSGMSGDRYARPARPGGSWRWSPASGNTCWGNFPWES